MNQTILVLGGGVGGVVTAVELRKKLPAAQGTEGGPRRGPARRWHWGKIAFEKIWLRKWF
jgi:hypothetical protein